MSRFYEGDGENPVGIMWTANIERICRGKRGQKLLREFIAALLALPERRLIADAIQDLKTGDVCAVGALGLHRGLNLSDYEDDEAGTLQLGEDMGLGYMLAWELGARNDIYSPKLSLGRKCVMLDVPIEEERGWKGDRPSFTIRAVTSGVLRGYSPEERWQRLSDWASKRVKWNLPVAA